MLKTFYNILLHNGIATYRYKNSHAPEQKRLQMAHLEQQTRQGVLFAVRNKEDFSKHGVKGYIINSKERLLEDVARLSHFTPNVYRFGAYTDTKRTIVHGFVETNLQQINAFVVDIDTKAFSVQDILLACLDDSIGAPTAIVASPRGYQVYFVLSEPLFISNKNDFQGLKVAKRIAANLKTSLQAVQADPYCNDFGFFRAPTEQNLVWVQLEQTYSIKQWIDWSMRQQEDAPFYAVRPNPSTNNLMHTDWFHALVNSAHIKGAKGQIGRNNTLFTLALICYSEGKSANEAFDIIDEFNANLHQPLAHHELTTVVRSAYSGRYRGASKQYIEELLALYVPHQQFELPTGGWYKFKKERHERSRSHYTEWEADIIAYITAQKCTTGPFIWRSQKQLCEALNMPQSSLNEIIKKSEQLVLIRKGKGRGAKTGWTTVAIYINYVRTQAQKLSQQKSALRISLWSFIAETNFIASIACTKLIEQLYQIMPYKLPKLVGNSG
ncbi:primase C-terminal domain-containing protein [Kurthia huakuii]|uniref:primase C-terminal domain-containing protein n=1 Tax=Kurthia huakuii TaxID=1421019 RepID=UPI0004984906|nr:primase C-terminal domain-containing protein [Kurthia huakuii]MBM7700642.1 DNA-binding MarR family transcriptional regulator [Kurthia huakuii]